MFFRNILTLFSLLAAAGLLVGCVTLTETERKLLNGSYSDVEKLSETKLSGKEQVSTPDLYALCLSYSKLKRYDKLFPCLDRLEANIRRGDKREFDSSKTSLATIQARTGMATGTILLGGSLEGDISPLPNIMRTEAYTELGKYNEAIAEGKKSLERIPDIAHHGNRWRIRALSALGLAYALSGDKTNALVSANSLGDIGISALQNSLDDDKVVGLGKIYMALGDYAKALSLIGEQQNSFFGKLRRDESRINDRFFSVNERGRRAFADLPKKFMINKCLFETGKIAEAKTGYDKLLAIPETRDNGDIYWLILYDRGRIAEQEGARRQAIDYYKKAVEVVEAERASINTEASKIGFIGDKQAVYQKLVEALLAESDAAAAFEYVERAKARALVDMLASKQDFAVHTANAAEARALLARANTAEAEGRVQDVSAETARQRSLAVQTRQQLRQQAPELSSLVSVNIPSLKELRAKLPADETLVEYYYDNQSLYAFVLTRESLKAVRLESGDLAREVKAFREALASPKGQAYLPYAQALHRRLVAPLTPYLAQPNLLIVAHGVLHYLPFNALHDGHEYLVDRYRLRQLPSASVLPFLHRGVPPKGGALLAFGNPDLGDRRYDLAYAQNEAVAVAKLLPTSRALLRKEASLSAFKRYGGSFRYLHFATHGDFNADDPLNSALLLSPDGQSDGRLTVSELYSTRLEANLVTLSACETGLGKIANGDDVVGLTRGFLYAGSHSIVASLWKVDDEATAYLMTRFYSALKGTSKREALRHAQIETRKKYPHPFYWAAFQLTGEAS